MPADALTETGLAAEMWCPACGAMRPMYIPECAACMDELRKLRPEWFLDPKSTKPEPRESL